MTIRSRFIQRLGWLLFWLFLLHLAIEVTGHHYLYTTISKTILKGKLGPDIEEYKEMQNREVATLHPQPWRKHLDFNAINLLPEEEAYHNENASVAFVVIKNDQLLFEKYWEDFDESTRSNSFSMAKSIVGLLTGIALDKEWIESIDKPVYWYLPQYETDLGKEMTIKHLLTMSSGLNFAEHYLNPFAYPARANYGDNLELLHLNYEVTEKPGVYYRYKSGSTQVLAFVLQAATRRNLSDLASEYVWQKIGAEHPALWSLDQEDGVERAFCCFNATALDFARIGRVYKDHGMWDSTRLVDSAYVEASISPSGTLNADGTPCEIYGYQWWIGDEPEAPFFFMRGIHGQYVLVDRAADLIVVRLGRIRDTGDGAKAHPDDVYRYLEMGRRIANEVATP